jgi:hypothetical protein
MHTHVFPRLLLIGFMFALLAAGTVHYKAAADTMNWTETASGEDEFVHACNGFDITTSYTSNLAYHAVGNTSGDQVYQRLNVSFVGTLINAKNGQSLPYDGKFTRTSDYHLGRVMVTDLELRIQLPTPSDWNVTIARQEMDLLANPVDVIQTVASRQLNSGLCVMLGRWANSDDLGRPPYGPPSSGTTEWIPQTPVADSGDGNTAPLPPCDRPRLDPAYNC